MTRQLQDGPTLIDLHPEYVADQAGNPVAVVLPLDELGALLEDLQDLGDVLKTRDEPTIPWESIKAELGVE